MILSVSYDAVRWMKAAGVFNRFWKFTSMKLVRTKTCSVQVHSQRMQACSTEIFLGNF